jgi:hypothetical protein
VARLLIISPFIVVGGVLIASGSAMVWCSLERVLGFIYFSPLLAAGVLLWCSAAFVAVLLRRSEPHP